ncbi:uncharacterized protein LOC134820859 isoform X2 [Bolinopsis microptera]|uniref:uncharacterized protein LOC134820859 isoform X2 n=1 Tax=Bolinopsis microptera TaxID=2820187 RepID=UPI0030794E88
MDDSINSDVNERNNGTISTLQLIDSAHIVSSAVLVILHNVLLLLLTLLHLIAGYVYITLQWLCLYTPVVIQGVGWVFSSLFSVTSQADDVILSLSDSLYHVIDSSLDTLATWTVELQILLPYFVAVPFQVLRILLDWSKIVGGVFTYLIPSEFYTAQTVSYLMELKFAFLDLSGVSWIILKSVMEQSSNFIFNTLISLITSAKYITYFIIRALQISCCQILPTMFETVCSSLILVLTKLLNVPSQIFFNLCVLVEYYELELENIKMVIVLSVQLIVSLFYHAYFYTVQLFLLIFQPILSLMEFTIYLLHATFSVLIPGGLVTILIGLITFWKWYNPTQPHPSPTSPPPQTIQFTPPAPPTEPQTPEEELQEQLNTEREEKLCVICTVNMKCAVLLPCRHCCLCLECSEKVRNVEQPQCPLCRRNIANVMQIYL